MYKDDIIADVEMCFQQITSLIDLILECNNENTPNLLTLRDLAQSGLEKIIKFN